MFDFVRMRGFLAVAFIAAAAASNALASHKQRARERSRSGDAAREGACS